jgi:hypothetical protein
VFVPVTGTNPKSETHLLATLAGMTPAETYIRLLFAIRVRMLLIWPYNAQPALLKNSTRSRQQRRNADNRDIGLIYAGSTP